MELFIMKKIFFPLITGALLSVPFIFENTEAQAAGNTSNSSTNVKLEVIPGDFSVKFKDSNNKFDDVNLNGAKTSSVALNDLYVTDLSGTGHGYEVTLAATQFKSIHDNKTIPTQSLMLNSVPKGEAIGDDPTTSPIPKNLGKDIFLDAVDTGTGGVILSADRDEGMGEYKYSFSKDNLSFAANAGDLYSGTYQTVITADMHVPVK